MVHALEVSVPAKVIKTLLQSSRPMLAKIGFIGFSLKIRRILSLNHGFSYVVREGIFNQQDQAVRGMRRDGQVKRDSVVTVICHAGACYPNADGGH